VILKGSLFGWLESKEICFLLILGLSLANGKWLWSFDDFAIFWLVARLIGLMMNLICRTIELAMFWGLRRISVDFDEGIRDVCYVWSVKRLWTFFSGRLWWYGRDRFWVDWKAKKYLPVCLMFNYWSIGLHFASFVECSLISLMFQFKGGYQEKLYWKTCFLLPKSFWLDGFNTEELMLNGLALTRSPRTERKCWLGFSILDLTPIYLSLSLILFGLVPILDDFGCGFVSIGTRFEQMISCDWRPCQKTVSGCIQIYSLLSRLAITQLIEYGHWFCSGEYDIYEMTDSVIGGLSGHEWPVQ